MENLLAQLYDMMGRSPSETAPPPAPPSTPSAAASTPPSAASNVLAEAASALARGSDEALTVTASARVRYVTGTWATVGARIRARKESADKARAPVDVCVVLDRSGSMGSERKLDLCKETIQLLLDELKDEDRFALISFDDQVQVEVALARVGDKEGLSRRVKALRPGKTTNLSGGLFAGLEEMKKTASTGEGRVRAVLLLTDGEANVGVVDPDKLIKVTAQLLQADLNCSLYTFGYGASHNAALLQQLATAAGDGKGGYYFVEAAEGVIGAFADCLGGLVSVVAQNVVLEIVSTARVKRVRREGAVQSEDGHWRVPLGDLFAEEQRDVLVELEARPAMSSEEVQATFEVQYVDVAAAQLRSSRASAAVARVASSDPRLAAQAPDAHIVCQLARLDVADALADARRDADDGDLPKARATLTKARASVEQTRAALAKDKVDDGALLERLVFDVDECLKSTQSTAEYARQGGAMRFQSKLMGHTMQRCMSDSDSDDEEDRGSLRKVRNAYRNATKAATKKSWASRRTAPDEVKK